MWVASSVNDFIYTNANYNFDLKYFANINNTVITQLATLMTYANISCKNADISSFVHFYSEYRIDKPMLPVETECCSLSS